MQISANSGTLHLRNTEANLEAAAPARRNAGVIAPLLRRAELAVAAPILAMPKLADCRYDGMLNDAR